jgi:predicted N-acyltransferase
VEQLTLRVIDRIEKVSEESWDALVQADPSATPFQSWAFLEALEYAGCVALERGWLPRHLTLWRGGRLVGAAPAYIKTDSSGDFSRDWGFADFAQRAGVPFYPKLVLAVPFTPVPSHRIFVAPGEDRAGCVAALGAAARELARELDLTGVQVLFSEPDEVDELEAAGLARRVLFQYHWFNRGYGSWDEWLAAMSSKRRHMIKRERRAPAEQGIHIRTIRGDELRERPQVWAREIHRLYCTTVDKFVWGRRYLNGAFFERILNRKPGCAEFVEARCNGRRVAGAFNVASATRLFGRYWGCHEEHRFLHFNVCLYHSIDDCIRRGRQVFEGGIGGEHKLLRGFEPVLVPAAHAYTEPRFDEAIRAYLNQETRARERELAQWEARKKR